LTIIIKVVYIVSKRATFLLLSGSKKKLAIPEGHAYSGCTPCLCRPTI
jgi:hypothetical protein